MAKNSPLSRWASKPVVKDLRFQLDLDDPKLPDEQRVTLRGDRGELESLSDAVTTYIQDFLATSCDRLSAVQVTTETDASPVSLAPPVSLASTMASPSDSAPASFHGTEVKLQPKGLTSHELFLGALATEESGAVVCLSTLQLFDLANALEEYAADVLDLPNLTKPAPLGQGFNWAQIAAVLLVAVGLSTSVVKLLDGSSNAPMTATSSQGASSADQKIASQLSPSVAEKATPAVISAERLPPFPTPSPTPRGKSGLPTVVTPKSPVSNASSGNLPDEAIATYPVPGNPTIIASEAEPSTKANAKNQANTSGTIAIAPPATPLEQPNSPITSGSSAAGSSLAAAPSARRSAQESADAANAAGSTAFDTISQIAEVREYFQQRWTPPEGLTQTLEYSLQINPDGSLQSIIPLKQVSGDYIDRTGMPLIGEPFVSPISSGKSAKVRLVLDPNGKVQTFNETP
jgi:hypothetical protein